MNICTHLLLIASALSVAGGCSTRPHETVTESSGPRVARTTLVPCSTAPTSDEYAVYSIVIETMHFETWPPPARGGTTGTVRLLVIKDHTYGPGGEFNPEPFLDPVRDDVRSLPALLEDFRHVNATSCPLEDRFNVAITRKLISAEEMDHLGGGRPDFWQRFYEHYPDAEGVLTFSRVAFSPTDGEALVYCGYVRQKLDGAGYYFVLRRSNEQWNVVRRVMAWIS